jgi:hypothetical protein
MICIRHRRSSIDGSRDLGKTAFTFAGMTRRLMGTPIERRESGIQFIIQSPCYPSLQLPTQPSDPGVDISRDCFVVSSLSLQVAPGRVVQ